MRFFALLVWVLALSWLTHAAASSSWRAPTSVQVFLSTDQAAEVSGWVARPATTEIVAGPGGSIVLNPDNSDKWGRAVRLIPVAPSENLYRLKATLTTALPPAERLTLFPKPVFHLHVSHGSRRYPLVERPMFFHNEVRVDELVKLTGEHEEVELSLITSANSNWRVSNLSLSAVHEHRRYNGGFSALVGVWGLTFLWGVVKAWRRSRVPTLAVVGLLSLVLIGVLASPEQVQKLFEIISNGVRVVGGQVTAGHFSTFMQSGHIGLFCVLTMTALIFRRQWYLTYIQILSGIFVLAIATEALQRHAFGRSPDVQDFIFDVFGIAIGTILFELGRGLFSLFNRRKS